MSVNRVCDDTSHGNSSEDFSHSRPFAVACFGGLKTCRCESENSYGYDDLFHFVTFHVFVLSELERGDVTRLFSVYSADRFRYGFKGL
jgi:hypothetical protein